MTRKIIFLLLLSAMPAYAYAQSYVVTKVKGTVSYNGVILYPGATISGTGNLQAKSTNAIIWLTNPEKGNCPISFHNGRPSKIKQKENESEIYEVLLRELIEKWVTRTKMLSTKSSEQSDWFKVFYGASVDSSTNQLLLIESERISSSSQNYPNAEKLSFFATLYPGRKDSVLRKLPVINHQIQFNSLVFPLREKFLWKLKIKDTKQTTKNTLLTINDTPLQGYIMPIEDLKEIITFFKEDWNRCYKSIIELKEAFYDYLQVNYGHYDISYIKTIAEVQFEQ
jgi:hypothetical protein